MRMLLQLFLSAAIVLPSPAPLKTIVNAHASPLCSSLHELVMPSMQTVLSNESFFADARRNLAKVHDAILKLGPGALRGRIADSEALHNSIALPLANTQWDAYQLLDHVATIDKALANSYRQFPQGANARLDALRLRVKNIAKIERQYANSLLAEASLIDDNTPVAAKADAYVKKLRNIAPAGDVQDENNVGLRLLQFANDEAKIKSDSYVTGRELDPVALQKEPPQLLHIHLLYELNDIKAPAISAVNDCDGAGASTTQSPKP